MNPTIETARIRIMLASDAEMTQIISEEPVPELQQAYREKQDNSRACPNMRDLYALWLIRERTPDAAILGSLCFRGLAEDGMVEIGYGLAPAYEGKGYMTEAVAAMVDWVLHRDGVTRVEAEAEATNIPSIRVLERAGFVPTGIMGEEGPRFVCCTSDSVNA